MFDSSPSNAVAQQLQHEQQPEQHEQQQQQLGVLAAALEAAYAPSMPLRFVPIAPPLLEPRDDELPFCYPRAQCDAHALDLAFPMTKPTVRDAMMKACSVPLTQQQMDTLSSVIHAHARQCPMSALAAAAPYVANMAENNPSFAPHYLVRVETIANENVKTAVRDALCKAPITLHVLEAVAQCYADAPPAASSSPSPSSTSSAGGAAPAAQGGAAMPPDLLLLFSRSCLARCNALADAAERKKPSKADAAATTSTVCLVAKYFRLLLASSTARAIVLNDPSLPAEIQAFCLRFSELHEPTALYKTLCALHS